MASTSTLKVVDNVVAHLDSDDPNPAPLSEIRTYALKFAEADTTAKLINNIFKGKQDNGALPFFILRFGGGDDQNKDTAVSAVSDERTNTGIGTAPSAKVKDGQ